MGMGGGTSRPMSGGSVYPPSNLYQSQPYQPLQPSTTGGKGGGQPVQMQLPQQMRGMVADTMQRPQQPDRQRLMQMYGDMIRAQQNPTAQQPQPRQYQTQQPPQLQGLGGLLGGLFGGFGGYR